ncbi:hypothetical protein JXL83_04150 [candidate division WOR-3 bacterium]|nr:hypothetical protein [candidate division WOR-3 bacterium]
MIAFSVKGQEEALGYLERTRAENRIPSLFIFYGPRGVGKTSAAFEFADHANDKTFRSLVHPDLIFVAPTDSSDPDEIEEQQNESLKNRVWRISESPNFSIRICQIRRVQEKLLYRPYSAKKRFVIVVDAHRMRVEAANAFLKTLEEPPQDTAVIMTTSHLSSLLPTVVSRAVLLRFRPLDKKVISMVISEKTGLNKNDAEKAAQLSDGSLTKAIELAFDEDKNETRKNFISAFLSADKKKIYSSWPSRMSERELIFTVIESLHSLCADFVFASNGMSNNLRNPDFADRILKFIRNRDVRHFFRCEEACLEAERALNLNIESGLIRDYLIEKTL